MKRASVIFASCLAIAASPAFAQPSTQPAAAVAPTPAPVERATADAVARLYAQIGSERLDGMLVSEFIDRVGGKSIVMDGLSRARQIGGPRELASGVVQVSLEIDGRRVADLLDRAANAAPDKSPMPHYRLAAQLRLLSRRSFASTGDNVEATFRVDGVAGEGLVAQTQETPLTLPDTPPAWTNESQTVAAVASYADSPLRTARAAEKAARAALAEQLGKLTLEGTSTLGSSGKSGADAINLAAEAARISAVEYRADGSVSVTVSLDGQQLWQMLLLSAHE